MKTSSSIKLLVLSVFLICVLASGFVVFPDAYAVPDTWTVADITNIGGSTLRGVSMGDVGNGVAVGDFGVIFWTDDGGDTWNIPTTNPALGNVDINGVSMADAGNGVAVGGGGTIIWTDDGGDTWNAAAINPVAGTITLRGVSMADAGIGVAVGDSGTIVYTTNGGASWDAADKSRIIKNDRRGVSMTDAGIGVAVGDSGNIVYTTDGGASWDQGDVADVAESNRMYGVSMIDPGNGVAVGDGGVIFWTDDGGDTWNIPTTNPALGNVDINGVSMADASNGVAVGGGGTIVYTTDGGASWDQGDVVTDAAGTNTMYGVSMTDAINGLAVGASGTIVYTILITDSTQNNNGGSSANKHLTKPTFGIDHKTFRPIVDDGFTFNGEKFNITDNFWTPFDIQTINVGDTNTFSAKVYAEKQLQVQEFLFGIPQIGQAHEAELDIEVFYNYNGEIDRVNVAQKSDIIDVDTLIVTHQKSKCKVDDAKELCDVTELSMKFLEPLKDNVMAIKAIDYKNRSHITYLNDGFDVTGDSLNPMDVALIPGSEKYEGLLEVTRVAKYSNTWSAADGRTFESDDSESFRLIYLLPYVRQADTGEPKNRLHSEFSKIQQYEADRAVTTLKQLCNSCTDEPYGEIHDILGYEYLESFESKYDNPELQEKLTFEDIRAQKILVKLFESIYPSKVFD